MAITYTQLQADITRAKRAKAVIADLKALKARDDAARKINATVSLYVQRATDTGPFSDEANK